MPQVTGKIAKSLSLGFTTTEPKTTLNNRFSRRLIKKISKTYHRRNQMIKTQFMFNKIKFIRFSIVEILVIRVL
jgi:hypothetical protein